MEKLTVLSFGGGQDSTAILYKITNDAVFKEKYIKGDLIVIMSDTGNEHPKTYQHVSKTIKPLCEENNIPFFFIGNKMGFHSDKWPDLVSFYKRTQTCGSKAFMKTCTDNLKIKVIYNFLENFIGIACGYKIGRKNATKSFAREYGKIRMIIGFAFGEESRIGKNANRPKWMQNSIEFIYPLSSEGMDRGACIDYIATQQSELVYPSNCMICPYMDEVELVWLYRNHPAAFQEWREIEKGKLDKFGPGEKTIKFKNVGVFGNEETLIRVLRRSLKKYGDMTMVELNEYKLSHGHCIKSKY